MNPDAARVGHWHALRALAPATLIAAILVVAGCAAASKTGITATTLAERVTQARTPADHENLASYFDEQAATAERASEECRQLRKGYERTPQSLFYSIGLAPAMLMHYDDLIENHRRNAESYRSLADWHRQQAKPDSGSAGGAEPAKELRH